MGENTNAATDTINCVTFYKIHKRTQVKQNEAPLVFIQTRNYEIRTPVKGFS